MSDARAPANPPHLRLGKTRPDKALVETLQGKILHFLRERDCWVTPQGWSFTAWRKNLVFLLFFLPSRIKCGSFEEKANRIQDFIVAGIKPLWLGCSGGESSRDLHIPSLVVRGQRVKLCSCMAREELPDLP